MNTLLLSLVPPIFGTLICNVTVALEGRGDEAQFYSAGAPQQHCTYYLTNCARPLLGDVFDDAGIVADRIQMARVLNNERQMLNSCAIFAPDGSDCWYVPSGA